MSEVERLIRVVIKQGGKLQVVFGDGEPTWDLVGVKEGKPRIEFENNVAKLSMDASTLEGGPPRKGDTFEAGRIGAVVKGRYTDDNGSFEITTQRSNENV